MTVEQAPESSDGKLQQGVPDRKRVSQGHGGTCAALSIDRGRGDLHISGPFIKQAGDNIRLKPKAVTARVPSLDIVSKMNGQTIVVLNLVSADGIDKKSKRIGEKLSGGAFSENVFLFLKGNDHVGLADMLEDVDQDFLWLGIITTT